MQNAPREHFAILSTFIKLPFAFKTFVMSIFEWPLKWPGFTVVSCCGAQHHKFTTHNIIGSFFKRTLPKLYGWSGKKYSVPITLEEGSDKVLDLGSKGGKFETPRRCCVLEHDTLSSA